MKTNVIAFTKTPVDRSPREGVPLPVAGMCPPSSALLSSAIRAIHKRSAFRNLFLFWPHLREACLKLAGYYTNIVPAPTAGLSLLEASLADALERYEIAEARGDDPLCSVRCFIEGSLNFANVVTERSMYGKNAKGEWVLWQPFSVPVSTWIQKNRISHVHFEDKPAVAHASKSLARIMLAPSVYNIHDLSTGCASTGDCTFSAGCEGHKKILP